MSFNLSIDFFQFILAEIANLIAWFEQMFVLCLNYRKENYD